jgi:hypothetical protein
MSTARKKDWQRKKDCKKAKKNFRREQAASTKIPTQCLSHTASVFPLRRLARFARLLCGNNNYTFGIRKFVPVLSFVLFWAMAGSTMCRTNATSTFTNSTLYSVHLCFVSLSELKWPSSVVTFSNFILGPQGVFMRFKIKSFHLPNLMIDQYVK